MDRWKNKKLRAIIKNERLFLERVRGEILLEELIECCDGKSNPIKFFSADQIVNATENFCKSSLVSGLFGYERWYSGTLNHHTILVKKLWRAQPPHPRDFYPEARDIAISSMVSGHKNFMKLVGCCLEIDIPFLVYYGAEKHYSSIDLNIVVSWEKRLKIAEDVATALAYLHSAFQRPFVYANMNLRNIILDKDGVAKLNDFSRCVSIPEGETFVKLSSRFAKGAYVYFDDNYLINHVVSEKTDAFGFGIFIQKLITGEENFRELYGGILQRDRLERKVPKWLPKSVGEGRFEDVVDPKMGEISEEERSRMEAFIFLSERCMGDRGEVPKMVEVAKELKGFLRNATSSTESPKSILSNHLFPKNRP